uniref:Retinaldehyde-binding protein 1 n=1 Tax=Phallusia mammillata TaxID=59560 RepID=A0A6F9DQ86_9ASCI|nr:retinaldehyde-binding protein 1 [Phallusia mammillata]
MEQGSDETIKMQQPPILCTGLSKAAITKACNELGESDERKAEALAELRELITTGCREENLASKYKDSTDIYLLRFLRTKKYNVERSYKQLTDHERFLKKHKFLERVDNKFARQRVAKCQPGLLTQRDDEGHVVFMFKMKDWDPNDVSFSDVVATYIYIFDKLLDSEETQVHGVKIIMNLQGYSLKQMLGVGLSEYKQMVDMLQGSVPFRFKGVYLINQPAIFVQTFNLIKVFLSEKLRSRIHVYGKDLSGFFKHFPEQTIPSDFGGKAPEYDGLSAANALLS